MKNAILLSLAVFLLSSCATLDKNGNKKDPYGLHLDGELGRGAARNGSLDSSDSAGRPYTAEKTSIFVWDRDSHGKPYVVEGAQVTCEATDPPQVFRRNTDKEGKVTFQTASEITCWVDFKGRTHPIDQAVEDDDTIPNKGFILFVIPKEGE